MEKQVDKSHYDFSSYMTKERWMSVWHQLDEVLKLKPNIILEVGPGPGVFKAAATALGVSVETLDIDPDLKPDYVSSVFNMPFKDDEFDVVCAFQMLEHLPFEKSLEAFSEMARVAKKSIVISLPDSRKLWKYWLYIPKLGNLKFHIPRPSTGPKKHVFDGEHYWEINKKNYSLEKICRDFESIGSVRLDKTYRVYENPYHRFFVFSLKG